MKYLCPKDCEGRSPTCHIDCKTHQLYREINEKEKDKRKKEIAVIVYQCDQKSKYIRDRRNHKIHRKGKDK